jgi:hypothetical protein
VSLLLGNTQFKLDKCVVVEGDALLGCGTANLDPTSGGLSLLNKATCSEESNFTLAFPDLFGDLGLI